MKTLKNIFIQSILLTSFASAQWSSDPSLPQMIGTGVQPQVAPTSVADRFKERNLDIISSPIVFIEKFLPNFKI
ncbi:MAG: hypothetical protein CMG62_01820 [Candidatus Marinimicrobia bacterium]|nr:hypothetical protein [Candidatus Neomarinimicrobiota bacterium]|tara:strand:- start:363 stop:584 length:222 start_codon:yes stop_codon:yes gene_type:complete